MIYEKRGNLKLKYRNREFWCRGYYVYTAGKNAVKIKEYIKNQLKEDKLGEQLTFSNTDPFMGSEQPINQRKTRDLTQKLYPIIT